MFTATPIQHLLLTAVALLKITDKHHFVDAVPAPILSAFPNHHIVPSTHQDHVIPSTHQDNVILPTHQDHIIPPNHADLVPRHDYEPGDVLNRTMCFCTSDNSLEQTDNDPEAFINIIAGHQMSYMYEFLYYNHRLDRSMILSSAPKICPTRGSDQDPYYHNECLAWEKQNIDICAEYTWPNNTLPFTPPHPENIWWWQFCYLFRGDQLDDPKKRDFFTFDHGKRAIPRKRDFIVGPEKVAQRCGEMCKGQGMEMFESKYGGWFNRMDGFHHFDDICTANMDCINGPDPWIKQPPTVLQS
ncbi:MAG: hypothetical protein Q9177_002654 [Variospora cf. flavescens]